MREHVLTSLGLLVGYALLTGGVLFSAVTPNDQWFRTRAVVPNTLDAQYSTEGLAAGSMITLGGLALLAMVKTVESPTMTPRESIGMFFSSLVVVGLAVGLCVVFLSMKVPGGAYMRYEE